MDRKGGVQKTEKQVFGAWGEEQASLFLVTQGYTIIERNYRVKEGEIDIIAWHEKYHWGKTLCFVEVKTRRDEFGSAERATNYTKQQRIIRAARHYCIARGISIEVTPIQFEQVSVYMTKGAVAPQCHIFVIPIEGK